MLRSFTIAIFLLACNQTSYQNPHVIIDTNFGEIELELFPDKAPKTVAAFLSYVDSGYYNNSSFYRVLKPGDQPAEISTGIIQGGIWQTNPSMKMQLMGIPHESTKKSGLTHTDGTVSLARTSPGTATSEFFICIGDQSPLDSGRRGTQDGFGMAAFGKVVKGMSIVRKIQSRPSHDDQFDDKINISRIKKI